MIELLTRLTPPLSLLLSLLLLCRPWVLRHLGARVQYGLWLTAPVLLLVLNLPMPLAQASSGLQHYQFRLQQISADIRQHDGLLLGYSLGLGLYLAWLGLSWLRLRQLRRRTRPGDTRGQFVSQEIQGPFITGLLQPAVILPWDFEQRFDDRQRQLILQHELQHWRRGDLHFNLLALGLSGLFWFNPLCVLAYRCFRQDQEMACDAVVTADLSAKDLIAYGRALLGNAGGSPQHWQLLTHHYGDKHVMKQRLMQLKTQHGFSRSSLLLPLVLTVGLGIWSQAPAIAGEKQTAPHPLMRVEPKYPLQAAKDKITGYVQASFDIDQDGKVFNVKLLKSEPAGVFDKVATRALSQWQYEPKASKGMLVQLDFELDPPAPNAPAIADVTAPSAPEELERIVITENDH